MMLYPSRQDLPGHVPPRLVVDYDVFHVDAPDGDFGAAMVRLRASGVPRLFWTQRNGGHWVATGADLVREVIEDAGRFSSRAMRVPKQANPVPPMIPLMIDPPAHGLYRRLIAPALTPKRVRALENRARSLSIGLIEALAPRGGCEFVGDFAQHMPIAIFMGMLDLPAEDRPLILGIVDRIVRPDIPETRMRGFAELAHYTGALATARRLAPGEDMVSSLIAADFGGRPLDETELQGLMTVLMLAGLDTVASMLTFIARFLATSPDHRRMLVAYPALLTDAIEEFLRRMAMVNLTRELAHDTELGSVQLKAGDLIVAPTALANFPDDANSPDAGGDWLAVDFHRPRRPHMTFGAGAHYCPGSMLARTEVRIFLEEWLKRIPDFSIADDARLEIKVGAAVMIPRLPLVWDCPPPPAHRAA